MTGAVLLVLLAVGISVCVLLVWLFVPRSEGP
jgi:hypothetical protein